MGQVVFRRIHGHIVPIKMKEKSNTPTRPTYLQKQVVGGAKIGAGFGVGVGLSQGFNRVGQLHAVNGGVKQTNALLGQISKKLVDFRVGQYRALASQGGVISLKAHRAINNSEMVLRKFSKVFPALYKTNMILRPTLKAAAIGATIGIGAGLLGFALRKRKK